MEFKKTLAFEVKAMGDDEDDAGTFEGMASTDDLDLHGDIVSPSAFKACIKANGGKCKLLWNHDSHSMPVGVVEEMKVVKGGLWVKGRLTMKNQKPRELRECLKDGSVDQMSIGFWTLDSEVMHKDGEQYRVINKLELREISLVNFPANPNAMVTDIKSIRDLEKSLRDEGLSNQEAKRAAVIASVVLKAIDGGRDDQSSIRDECVKREDGELDAELRKAFAKSDSLLKS